MASRQSRALERALTRLADQLEAALEEALDDEAEQVLADERSWVPVGPDDPHLRDALEVRDVGRFIRIVGVTDPEFIYAIWLEWGRKNAAAQPYATPSAEASRGRWPGRAEQAVRAVIRRL